MDYTSKKYYFHSVLLKELLFMYIWVVHGLGVSVLSTAMPCATMTADTTIVHSNVNRLPSTC